jgi:crotonobetaine/carnitine-CoA ligase
MSEIQLPAHEDVVVRCLLERNAVEAPDEVFVTFEDGAAWTRADALEQAYAAANALRAVGVRQDDVVGVFLPDGADFLRAWWGANVLGATMLPIHRAFHGSSLAHVLALGEPVVIVAESPFTERLADVDLGGAVLLEPATLRSGDSSPPELERSLRLWDVFALILTSGTTGPSKLSATTYHQIYVSGAALVLNWGGSARDVALLDLPLFHLAALFITVGSLAGRARLAVRSAPALDRYWEVARDTGATIGMLLSAMVPFLLAQPRRPAEAEHRLRLLMTAPLPPDVDAFRARFGVAEFTTAFGSTEVPGALGRTPDQPLLPGYCGRVRRGFEVRLVDGHDVEVPVGEVGQAVIRTELPWMLSAGYVKNPEATAAAWRNGWFHTGDLLRRDADGNFFYVDRGKDALRRRGENISSFEVETQLAAHPGVAEAACVPERSDAGVDDEVKVWIVPTPGVELDFAELLRHCLDRLPYFAVPRYFEQIDELPKTASARVQKYLLRERGNGELTWDRERHGMRVTRRGLVRA